MAERTLRLAVRCPDCMAHPPVRPSVNEVEAKLGLPPDEVVQTVQCGRCGCIYPVTAAAYQKAS